MTEEEKADALRCRTSLGEKEARLFTRLWEAMKDIDREEAEEDRVEHARRMSQQRR
jgi:hypothetical protein